MKPAEDIEPLIALAEDEFFTLHQNAVGAVTRLSQFWTKLYGPNELDDPIIALLNDVYDQFYEQGQYAETEVSA